MGSLLGGKKGQAVVTGYRYYFSLLAGICRGPVDEVFLIKSGGLIFWDGSATGPMLTADKYDPSNPYALSTTTAGFLAGYPGGSVTDNVMVPVSKPNLFGGDKGEGGIDGILWLYMGAKTQIISGADYIKLVMSGLRLSNMRGVVTAFFDGEITANNPYPKAWNYRVRRATKGWDGDPWYPERAVIRLTDPAIPAYLRGAGDTGSSFTTILYGTEGELVDGAGSSGSGTVTAVSSNYNGSTSTTYTAEGLSTTYAVPQAYNDIRAMNPAHIIYECCTNRDWGRGMDRALIDNVSFTDAANRLHDEGFGLCIKWTRTEDVDVFVQTVIDHIGAAVYTDRVTGLLSIRLIRGDYNVIDLPVFGYDTGLLEVTSVDQAANDATANEIVVKYHSPVLDTDKQARAQNIASIDQLGSVFSITKDYSGLPTSTLALQIAQRDLKVYTAGWKRVEFKLDRRAYTLVPGDVVVVNAPGRGLNNMIVRVGTVEDTVMTDGAITIVGSQDVYGLPLSPATFVQPEPPNFLEPMLLPVPISMSMVNEANYRDAVKNVGQSVVDQYDNTAHEKDGFMTVMALRPTPMSLSYEVLAFNQLAGTYPTTLDYQPIGSSVFSLMSLITTPINTTDTTFVISGEINPANTRIGSALLITNSLTIDTFHSEVVRLDAISVDPVSGLVTVTVGRGCTDTPAQSHTAGKLWVYDDHLSFDGDLLAWNEAVWYELFVHTSRGNSGPYHTVNNIYGRFRQPYSAADFRVNGHPRHEAPALTGALTFTWKHRNRVVQADQLIDESEADVGIELGQFYYLQMSGAGGTYATDGGTFMGTLTGNTLTVSAGAMAAAGFGVGRVQATLITKRADAGEFYPLNSFRNQVLFFDYTPSGVTAPTTGFNYNFNNNFGG